MHPQAPDVLWCAPGTGVVARLAALLHAQRLAPERTVMLVPYAQLMGVAQSAWARCGPPGFAPRFETTHNWARSAGGFVPGEDDIGFDMARDLLTAQSLLARAGLGAQRHALAGRLVPIAHQLAPLAAAQLPGERAAWAQRVGPAIEAGRGSEWFRTESALNGIALAWAANSAYATDRLLCGAARRQADALVVLQGLQADPLVQSLAALFGDSAFVMPMAVQPAPQGTVALHEAIDPGDEAERAAACVLRRLADGQAPVALVATDRALARRIGAQLETRGVRLRDETGWRLSTTRAAAALMSSLRAAAHDAGCDALLDWLKNAPAFDAGSVQALEARLREGGRREWAAARSALAASDMPRDVALQTFVEDIETRRCLLAGSRTPSQWLAALRGLLDSCGQWAALAADAAGRELIAALHLDEDAEAPETTQWSLREFTAWATEVLEAASFRPPLPSDALPQVVLLPLAQLLGRSFGALVLSGCDDQRLPAVPEPPGDWSVAQRALLGLPSREALEAAQRAAWTAALGVPQVDLLWRRADASGEPVRPSPLLQRLRLAGGARPADDPRQPRQVQPQPTGRPQPHGDALPIGMLSASAYDDLRHCPYRFFALRQLGLRSADELDTERGKRDFGTWLHAVLARFHEEQNRAPALDMAGRIAIISIAAEQVTREQALSSAEFLPFAAAWPAVRDGYLQWLAAYEADEQARVEACEPALRQPLGTLSLTGRLDRIDRLPDGQAFVIDYKTEALAATRRRVADPGEDTQLAFYAALLPDDRLRAAYLNVGEQASGTHLVEQCDVVAARDALVAGVLSDFERIGAGAPLPALGEGAVCEHCAARGLCRKDFWEEPAPETGVPGPSASATGPGAVALSERAASADDLGAAASSEGIPEMAAVRPDRPSAGIEPAADTASAPDADPAYEHNGRPVTRAAFYAVACDPRRSVAVEACAGAGKTWMLVSRILRALLQEGEAGCTPQQILAITFTRKAAGEMRERLDQWLEDFARRSLPELAEQLVQRGMAPAEAAAAAPRLQGLYARVLEGGRPVQFRTFHAWFAGLLRSAPLALLNQLGLPARYQLLEDDAPARARLWRPFFAAVAAEPKALADYQALVAANGRSQTAKALAETLARRVEFALADAQRPVEHDVQAAAERFPDWAGFETPGQALLEAPGSRALLLAAAQALGRASQASFAAKGAELLQALEAADTAGVCAALLTQKGEPRKFSAKMVGLDHVRAAQQRAVDFAAVQAQHEAWLHQQRMARLTRLLLAEYAALKRRQGWVDMNDVEQAARRLLGSGELWGWVQERLDTQLRHVLIDEFQDTNPLQWQALGAWLQGYAGAVDRRPSVFIVGDPKQSIYRFRRAELQVFIEAQRFVREGLEGDLLKCDHTRRNARAVVGLVNVAMLAAQEQGEFSGFRAHTTESRDAGAVWRLPPIPREVAEAVADVAASPAAGLPWRDSLATPRVLPEERLLQKECAQAACWIAARIAQGLAPRDIMVLARKRDRLALMQDELRKLHVPAQQPEKNALDDAPEVQDVVALLDALVSPGHDLSLARALKSPLFALDDDALVPLAVARRTALTGGGPAPSWFALLQGDGLPAPLAGIGARLRRWQDWIQALPPHDALTALYRDADVLARFAANAPASLRDSTLAHLRALLAASLELDGARFATPYALVRALCSRTLRAPAVAPADAVQLLTVHGAKGLEAELVLLLDSDAAAQRAQSMGVLVKWPGEAPAPQRFVFLASEKTPPACAVDDLLQEQAARQREELNALYVACTRARHELAISATAAARPHDGSWWARLAPLCAPVPAMPPGERGRTAPPLDPLGGFCLMEVPPLAPDTALTSEVVPEPSQEAADIRAAALGHAMHRLLEWSGADASWSGAQLRAVAREFGLTPALSRTAAQMARRVRAGAGAWAWDATLLDWEGNEVALVHQGKTLRIDRLVRRRSDGVWWVLDYKSAAHPERDAGLVTQLQRYSVAVQAARPGALVRAAFLSGQGELIELAVPA